VRPGHAGNAVALLDSVAPERAGKLSIYSKMRVYDGESLKDTDPKAKSYQEYRDYAGVDEGMNGLSTRFAFKILSRVFNFDHAEVAANPVHLFYVLEQQIEREQFPQEQAERYLEFLKGYLIPKYAEFIGKEIQTAYLESYSEYGQNIFDRYVTYADFWIRIRSIAIRIPASCLTVNR
jgi:serine protein kinase